MTLTVWERFGIHPASIGHAEAHGTGTALGDPIEVQALTDAFRRHSDLVGECALSSVKTNIGHAVPAAGIAGLLKTLLLLRHRTLVPSLHLNTPNPLIDFANSPFHVPRVAMPWPARQDGAPRRGTVNAFGFSGTNAHAVVAEAPPTPPAAGAAAGPQLFLISAKTPEALRQRAAGLARWLGQEAVPLADLAYTLAAGRSHFRCRAAIVAADAAALRDALQDIASGEAPGRPQGRPARRRPKPRLWPPWRRPQIRRRGRSHWACWPGPTGQGQPCAACIRAAAAGCCLCRPIRSSANAVGWRTAPGRRLRNRRRPWLLPYHPPPCPRMGKHGPGRSIG
ncbi:ketoacyl-synthetase C-terminal extension domain-containing protein [Siccirubricoccus deserti]